jgi:hypothetical protein
MRKPSEYVAAAMARLRGGSLSDCSEVLRHGGQSATVTRIGLAQRGEEVSDIEPPENCRVLAYVADFPAMKNGEAVELGQTRRVVTTCKTGPVGTLFIIGMSAPFDTDTMIIPAGAAPRRVLALVSDSDPDAENVGGAARAESWSVWWMCGERDGRNGPPRGSSIQFPDRRDLPSLYVQKCQRRGGLFHATCTANERFPAP